MPWGMLSLTESHAPKPLKGYSLTEMTFIGDHDHLVNGTLSEVLEIIAHRPDIGVVGMDCGYLLSLPDGAVLNGPEIIQWLSQHFGRKQQEELSNAQS